MQYRIDRSGNGYVNDLDFDHRHNTTRWFLEAFCRDFVHDLNYVAGVDKPEYEKGRGGKAVVFTRSELETQVWFDVIIDFEQKRAVVIPKNSDARSYLDRLKRNSLNLG